MLSRRKFIRNSSLAVAGAGISNISFGRAFSNPDFPVVISTWQHGVAANKAAWEVLSKGTYSLVAV